MNSFKRVISRYGASAMSGGLLVLPLVYGSYLAWQELQYRDALGPVREFAPVSAPVVPAAQPFKAQAIATVMGVNTQAAWVPSAEALQLRASFVSTQGPSQALLAGAQGSRFYSVGDLLPGGSVLRRVEVGHVVLWRNGREERLTLKPASRHVLPASATGSPDPLATSVHLRPLVGQP